MKKIFGLSTIAGLFLTLGAAGGCDYSGEALSKTLILIFIGLSMFLCGISFPHHVFKHCHRRLVTGKTIKKPVYKIKTSSGKSCCRSQKKLYTYNRNLIKGHQSVQAKF